MHAGLWIAQLSASMQVAVLAVDLLPMLAYPCSFWLAELQFWKAKYELLICGCAALCSAVLRVRCAVLRCAKSATLRQGTWVRQLFL